MIGDDPGFAPVVECKELHQEEQTEVLPEISLHAIARTSHPQTIQVLGKLKNKELMILIDGGSTHNFID